MNILKKNHRSVSSIFNELGFSLAEVTLVMGIIVVFLSIVGFSLSRSQHSSSLSTTLDTFLSDFKEQQIKAMTGDTQGGSTADNYGIHFDTTSYSLFRGATSSADLNKFVVNLPPTVQITNFFPDNQIIFFKGNGEVSGCCNLAGFKVTFNDVSANIEKTVTVNRMGAATVN